MKLKLQQNQAVSIFINCIIILFFSVNIAFGQDNDETECPYFNVFSSDTTGVAFALLSTNISATISGVIANVEIEQTYYNSGDSTISATYVFPMSTNAAVYGMQMELDGRTIDAVIKRRDEAQTIFENAEADGLTASLLEQERPNVFQMSLANIASGDSLIVRMVYTELLTPTNSVYRFLFPNIVGPRFTTNGEPWVYQTAQDSLPLSQTALNIDLKINAATPLEATCTSHNAPFAYSGNSAETTLSTNPGDDFIVDYTLDGNQIETGLLLYEGEEENFFLSMIQPAKPDIGFDSPQREYIFIMDVSGSMSGTPLDISKQLITNLLNDLNFDDKFNILFFAGGSSVLSPSSLEATSDNIDMAIDMLENFSGGGGTQLLPAMQTALNMGGTEGYSRTFVILTDGYVTVEKQAFDLIRENLNEANFFSFGIGTSVNHYIIEGIGYVGEGESFVATDFMDADEVADRFKQYIERPVLTNIEATFAGIDVYDIEPYSVPDVFAERPIIIYGKYHQPADGSVTVTGDYSDGVVTSSLNFADYTANNEENIALKYLWARKRIKLMSDYGIASNENDTISIEEEITLLGLQYNLVTEYTAFVAVDSSAVAGNNPPPDGGGTDNDGGVFVSTDAFYDADVSKISHITILGTVTDAGGLLQFQLKNLQSIDDQNLKVRITDINGRVISTHDLDPEDVESILTVRLGQLSTGYYFLSLVSENQVLDTEKFMVAN